MERLHRRDEQVSEPVAVHVSRSRDRPPEERARLLAVVLDQRGAVGTGQHLSHARGAPEVVVAVASDREVGHPVTVGVTECRDSPAEGVQAVHPLPLPQLVSVHAGEEVGHARGAEVADDEVRATVAVDVVGQIDVAAEAAGPGQRVEERAGGPGEHLDQILVHRRDDHVRHSVAAQVPAAGDPISHLGVPCRPLVAPDDPSARAVEQVHDAALPGGAELDARGDGDVRDRVAVDVTDPRHDVAEVVRAAAGPLMDQRSVLPGAKEGDPGVALNGWCSLNSTSSKPSWSTSPTPAAA